MATRVNMPSKDKMIVNLLVAERNLTIIYFEPVLLLLLLKKQTHDMKPLNFFN